MAYTGKTQYYDLGIYQDGDVIDPTDWNNNSEKIDTQMHINANGIAANNEKIAEITEHSGETDTTLASYGQRIQAVENKTEEQGTKITANETKTAENTVDIENLRTDVDTNTQNINALTGGKDFQDLVNEVNGLTEDVAGNNADIAKLQRSIVGNGYYYHPNDTFTYESTGSNGLSITGTVHESSENVLYLSLIIKFTHPNGGASATMPAASYKAEGNENFRALSVCGDFVSGTNFYNYTINGLIVQEVYGSSLNPYNLEVHLENLPTSLQYHSFDISLSRLNLVALTTR